MKDDLTQDSATQGTEPDMNCCSKYERLDFSEKETTKQYSYPVSSPNKYSTIRLKSKVGRIQKGEPSTPSGTSLRAWLFGAITLSKG